MLGYETSDMRPQAVACYKWWMSSEASGLHVQEPRGKLTLFSLGSAPVLAVRNNQSTL